MERCDYLGIGAHPDDVELLALPLILQARQQGKDFGAVVLTHGGEPRRQKEQQQAAELGGYAFVRILGYSSDELKGGQRSSVVEDLRCLLGDLQPQEIWTHDLADPHPTHVAATLAVIAALKALPAASRPKRLLGCEGWRSLDWLAREDRVLLPVDDPEGLSDRLLLAHASQVALRPYDKGAQGRRVGQAVFHDRDQAPPKELALAMDLTPLITDGGPTVADFLAGRLQHFSEEVLGRVRDAEKNS